MSDTNLQQNYRPTQHYKDIFVASGFFYDIPISERNDESFRNKAEKLYSTSKATMAILKQNDNHSDEIGLHQRTAYMSALVLLLYGRLDVVADILTYHTLASVGHFTYMVAEIIPLPSSLRSLQNVPAVLSWIEQHKHELQWDEDMGRFAIIESSRAL